MSERLPDSIPNNHTIQERPPIEGQPSGLIVAESNANHRYTQHPHFDGAEDNEVHEKTRGIVYNETQLAGKPFIIAERPGSQDQPQEAAPASEEPGFASAEQDDTPEAIVKVQYEPNEEGFAQTAFEITKEGVSVNLSDIGSGGALITTANNRTYFVNGEYIDDLTLLKDQDQSDEVDEWEFSADEKMPTVEIGKFLNIRGESIDGPIAKIEIKGSQEEASKLGDEYQTRGEDPFQKAEAILDEVFPDEHQPTPTELGAMIAERNPKGLRQRASHIMRRAAVFMKMKQHETAMYLTDEKNRRKVIAGGVLGFLATAGAVYADVKGVPFLSSGGEAALVPKPHHHEAIKHLHEQAATGRNGGTSAPGQRVTEGADGGVNAPAARESHPSFVRLKAGRNPWTVSQHRLETLGNAHPNPAQIEAYDKDMAHLNPNDYSYYGDSSENLPVGTKLTLPR